MRVKTAVVLATAFASLIDTTSAVSGFGRAAGKSFAHTIGAFAASTNVSSGDPSSFVVIVSASDDSNPTATIFDTSIPAPAKVMVLLPNGTSSLIAMTVFES